MTKKEREERKAGNRRRREAANLLRSLPNPDSNRARRERIVANAQVLGQAMAGIDQEIVKAGGVPPGMLVAAAHCAAVDEGPPAGTVVCRVVGRDGVKLNPEEIVYHDPPAGESQL